jgi:protein-tyrosine phosphatase
VVPDPYYGGIEGFEEVFQIVERSCRGLLETLEAGDLG